MNVPRLCRAQRGAVVIAVAMLSLGCGHAPTRVVRDTTPSWMKYELTGTRIPRAAGPRGHAESASFVTRTSPSGLLLMPGAVVVIQ